MSEPPPPRADIDAKTMWSGYVHGEYSVVYAGSQPRSSDGGQVGNSKLGVVVTVTSAGAYRTFTTASANGQLTITSAKGDVLTLTATDGTTYTFDAATDTLAEQG